MTLAVPPGAQDVEPFSVVTEESGQQVEEEEVLFSSTCPATKPSGLLAPHTPLALTCHYAGDSHAAHDAVPGQLRRVSYLFVHHEGIGRQS